MNDTFRAGGENYTFYQITRADAIAFALGLATPGDSYVNQRANGHFWVDRENARRAATEVVGTHLNLVGAAAKSYLDENFPAIWARFDVNEENKVEIDRMPQLLRMVCGNNEACIGL